MTGTVGAGDATLMLLVSVELGRMLVVVISNGSVHQAVASLACLASCLPLSVWSRHTTLIVASFLYRIGQGRKLSWFLADFCRSLLTFPVKSKPSYTLLSTLHFFLAILRHHHLKNSPTAICNSSVPSLMRGPGRTWTKRCTYRGKMVVQRTIWRGCSSPSMHFLSP